MPSLNTPNFTTWASGQTASGWSTFASDLASNWMSAWSSRFTLTTRWTTALGAICADDQAALIFAANKMAAAITAGLSTTVAGQYLDANPASSVVNNIQSGTTLEYLYANKPGIGLTPVSVRVSTWTIVLNCQA